MESKLARDLGTGLTVLKRMVKPQISRVGVSITYDCNQKCKTCDLWRVNKDNPQLKKQEMTLEEFGLFCETNPGLMWIALTGGEPYLKKDMKGFLDACCSIPSLRLISITTCGATPDKIESDVSHFLNNPRSKTITIATQVSFEGPEAQHDEISGTPGSYKRARESLRRLQKLASKDSRVRTGIAYTLSSYGLGGLEATLESLGEDRPPVGQVTVGIGQEADYYQWKDHKSVKPDSKGLVKELEWFRHEFKAKDRLDPYSFISEAYLRKAVKCYKDSQTFPKCVAGQYSCSVGPYWDVHPCIFLFGRRLGNLKDYNYNLTELLDSTRDTWEDWVKKCWDKGGCFNLCEDYCMIVMRPWRVL